jgi:5-oxoprolinase (ATP-hydrolysing) subunit A
LRIDLNADIGESSGTSDAHNDQLLMRSITSGSIACGFHAGNPSVMRSIVRLAVQAGVAIGAHPSFADPAGFGRREVNASPEEIANLVLYQVGALAAIAGAEGVKLQHVKPHGALYNMSVRRADIADAIAAAVASLDRSLVMIGLPGSELLKAAHCRGLPTAAEGFADRGYERDGSLMARDVSGAVLTDPEVVGDRALRMVRDRQLIARDGSVLTVKVETICIHGDTPGAAQLAATVRSALENAGIAVAALVRSG